MEITEHEIVNVITVILSRLDKLEDEQKKSKDFILELKDRLIDLSACVDDILDIISDSDDLLFAEKLKRYSKMKSMFLEQLECKESDFDTDVLKQLMSQVIGES